MLKYVIIVFYLLSSNLLVFGQATFGKTNLKQDFNKVEESDSLSENYAIVYGKFRPGMQFSMRFVDDYSGDRFAHFVVLGLLKDKNLISMKMEVKPINTPNEGQYIFCYRFPKGKYSIGQYTLAEDVENTWMPFIRLNQPPSVYLNNYGSNYYSFEVQENTVNYLGTWDFTRLGTEDFTKHEINFIDDKEELDLEMAEKFKKIDFRKAKVVIPN